MAQRIGGLMSPKNSGPDQRVPVMARAISEERRGIVCVRHIGTRLSTHLDV